MSRASSRLPCAANGRQLSSLGSTLFVGVTAVVLTIGVLVSPAPAQAALFQFDGAFGSGASASGRFVDPGGVDTDDAGRVFVADAGQGHVEVYDDAPGGNKFLATIGDRVLVRPVAVTLDIRDRIYVTDAGSGTVLMFDSFVDGHKLRRTFGDRDGTAIGQLSNPRFVVTDRASRVYVTERDNARVQWFRPKGSEKSEPVAAFGVGDPPELLDPEGIVRDGDGRLYVSDQSATDGEVRVYDPRGFPLARIIGPGAAEGQVVEPRGLFRDPFSRLIVVDSGNSRIQAFGPFSDPHGSTSGEDPSTDGKLSPEGLFTPEFKLPFGGVKFLESFGSAGSGPGNFSRPAGAALAPGALMYVTDAGNGRVVRLRYDDSDSDGALDERDTCKGITNPDQRNADRDGEGDACDGDDDNDGVADPRDRCARSRRGPDANHDGCGDPRSRISLPRDRATFARSRPPTLIAGRAAADEIGVAGVQVALARVRGRSCQWYRDGHFGRKGSCAAPVFFDAEGPERWVARVRLRARGSYRAISRATQQGGVVESLSSERNTHDFRIR